MDPITLLHTVILERDRRARTAMERRAARLARQAPRHAQVRRRAARARR